MQFSRAIILAAVAIATASAATVPQSNAVQAKDASASGSVAEFLAVRDSANAQVDSVASQTDSKLKVSIAKLEKLDPSSVTVQDLKPIFKEMNSYMQDAGNKLDTITSNNKRQDLNKAIDQLVADLNKTLLTLEPLLRHLTKNLKLGTVQDLVDLLTPGLASLIVGIEGLLVTLAPGLASIVDPLLALVEGLTASLGLNLNLPSLPSN